MRLRSLLLGLVFVAGVARADRTVPCYVGIPVSLTSNAPAGALTFGCPQFNPGLGALTAVYWAENVEVGQSVGTGSVQNNTSSDLTFWAFTINEPWQIGGNAYSILISLNDRSVLPWTSVLVGSNSTASFTMPGTLSVGGSTPVADMSPFIGTGQITGALGPTEVTDVLDPGLSLVNWNVSGTAWLQVTYEYTPAVVPEPGTLPSAGLALLGCFWMMRIRFQQS